MPRLLLDDWPRIALLALAQELGWITLPFQVEVVPSLTAQTARAHPDALVYVPLTEYAELQTSHTILPLFAAGGNHNAAVVLLADQPLGEINDCLVDLADSSRLAEALARGTLRKFYGITPIAWLRDERPEGDATPVVEVREGGEALHLLEEPGDRVVVDLGRAWFILTGLPAITHLLLVPDRVLRADPDLPQTLADALATADATTPNPPGRTPQRIVHSLRRLPREPGSPLRRPTHLTHRRRPEEPPRPAHRRRPQHGPPPRWPPQTPHRLRGRVTSR